MNKEKLAMLEGYIKAGISPILLEDIPTKAFEDAVVIEADCKISLLNGHYEGASYVAPAWYNELINNSKNMQPLLVVNGINSISVEEQQKFVELFKYKKISTFELPNNCVIIVTCSNLKEAPVNEEVYSLMAHI